MRAERSGDQGDDTEDRRKVPAPPELRPNLPPDPARPERREPGGYQSMGVAYSVPSALVAPVLVLVFVGAWADRRFGWSPWATLVGALLGFVCGMVNMVRMANRLNR